MRRIVLVSAAMILIAGSVLWRVFEWRESDYVRDPTLPQAPQFSLPALGGKTLTLDAIPGELRIVYFWASWSPYARNDLGVLARIKREHGDAVTVVALCRDTNLRDARLFAESLDLRDSVLFIFDQDDTYFKLAGGFAVPETLFLDPGGGILEQVHGPLAEAVLRDRITAHLKEVRDHRL